MGESLHGDAWNAAARATNILVSGVPARDRSVCQHRDGPPQGGRGHGASILIVDAHDDQRRRLATYARDRGLAVATASDGAHALELLAGGHFDAIFADIRIADEAGRPLLHAIRRQRPRSAVVLMSTRGSGDDAVRAVHAGAYYFLVKPLVLDHVGRVLDDILGVVPLRGRSPAS